MRHLCIHGLVALAMGMRADFEDEFAIAGEACDRGLHAGHEFDAPGGIAEWPSAVGGLLVKRGKADAEQPAVGITRFLPRPHGWKIDQLGSAFEDRAVVAAVERLLGDRHVGHLLRLHEIAQPDLQRVNADGLREAIHDELVADARQRTRDAAERLSGRLVAHHVDGATAQGADIVAALDVAERETALDPGRPRPWRVGAGVHDHIAFEAEDAALRVGITDDLALVVATIGIADEQLVAILDPSHRATQHHGRPGDADRFALDIGLETERCADVGRDHAQPALADAEDLRQSDLQRHRELMGDVDDKFVETVVVGGNAGAPLKRKGMHAVHAEASLDHMDRGGLGRGEVAAFELDVDQDIVAPLVVDKRLRLVERISHGHDGRQGLVLDLDARGEVLGFGRRCADDHGDRLADVPDFARGEDRPIGWLEAGKLRGRAHPADAGQIFGAKDVMLEACRLAYGEDAGVSMRAAHEHRVEHPRQLDVGAKLPATLKKPRVLQPRNPGADPKIVHRCAPAMMPTATQSKGYDITGRVTASELRWPFGARAL